MLIHFGWVAISLFILWQAHAMLTSPSCPFCGRKQEHARDCPQNK